MSAPHENQEPDLNLDFTQRAFEQFYDVVDDPYFRDQDLDKIYDALKDKIQIVPFGDFLKRYIYQKAELNGDYQEIPLSDYRDMICSSFQERQVPASFTPTTARLKNLAKNWLEQKTASRSVVLLLGFGLGMTAEDVDDFLIKALKEQRLTAKDPFEAVCWYCYKNGCSYLKFEQIWKAYAQSGSHAALPGSFSLDSTSVFKQRMVAVRNEEELMDYLKTLSVQAGTLRQSVRARRQFDRIYADIRDWTAEVLTGIEKDDSAVSQDRLMEILSRNERYYEFEKKEILEKAGSQYHQYRPEEIRAADVERVVFASVPKDKNGNLLPMKLSALFNQFSGTRLSRQHINDILSGKAQITRYDLITLSFLAFSRTIDQYSTVLKRYSAFIDETNGILEKSDMGPMYPVNPYESFLMMCMLTDDPVGTFSDVLELSYTDAAQ